MDGESSALPVEFLKHLAKSRRGARRGRETSHRPAFGMNASHAASSRPHFWSSPALFPSSVASHLPAAVSSFLFSARSLFSPPHSPRRRVVVRRPRRRAAAGAKPVPLLRANSPALHAVHGLHATSFRTDVSRSGVPHVSRRPDRRGASLVDDTETPYGRETLAAKLLVREGYPAAPVTAATYEGYRGDVPFPNAPPLRLDDAARHLPGRVGGRTRPRDGTSGKDDSYASAGLAPSRRGAVAAPTTQSWIGHEGSVVAAGRKGREQARAVLAHVAASHELSREVMQSTVRAIEYFTTTEAPPITAGDLARRLRTPPEERDRAGERGAAAFDAAAAAAAADGGDERRRKNGGAAAETKRSREDGSHDDDLTADPSAAFTVEGFVAAAIAAVVERVGASASEEDEGGSSAEAVPGTSAGPAGKYHDDDDDEPRFGVLQIRHESFPLDVAVGGPANDLAAMPPHYRSSLERQCVPRPWQSYGAGFRKPAGLDKYADAFDDRVRDGCDEMETGSRSGRDVERGGEDGAREHWRKTLVPNAVDLAGEAVAQMDAAAMEAEEAATAAKEAAREAEVQEMTDKLAAAMGKEAPASVVGDCFAAERKEAEWYK